MVSFCARFLPMYMRVEKFQGECKTVSIGSINTLWQVILVEDEMLKERCRRILKRIAWRMQYAAKTRFNRETAIIEEVFGDNLIDSIDSSIYVQELLMQIPEKPRFIIKSIVIDRLTEEEVAKQLNMTRQGVHKCKKKYLNVLAHKISNSPSF